MGNVDRYPQGVLKQASMITVCPSCQRKFRIYAQQLSAAKGVVQCGFCREQFDALEQLFDLPAPLTRSASKNNSTPANNLPDEPEFEIPGSSAENPSKEFKVIPATMTTG